MNPEFAYVCEKLKSLDNFTGPERDRQYVQVAMDIHKRGITEDDCMLTIIFKQHLARILKAMNEASTNDMIALLSSFKINP